MPEWAAGPRWNREGNGRVPYHLNNAEGVAGDAPQGAEVFRSFRGLPGDHGRVVVFLVEDRAQMQKVMEAFEEFRPAVWGAGLRRGVIMPNALFVLVAGAGSSPCTSGSQ
jgi:hypothetical protein